jgi:hypothetical protein
MLAAIAFMVDGDEADTPFRVDSCAAGNAIVPRESQSRWLPQGEELPAAIHRFLREFVPGAPNPVASAASRCGDL